MVLEARGWSTIPIIVVSARDQELEKIVALDAGADDYLAKPFGVGELLARLAPFAPIFLTPLPSLEKTR
jgi:two-component system KDP operon response regulator KdpE